VHKRKWIPQFSAFHHPQTTLLIASLFPALFQIHFKGMGINRAARQF